MMKRVIIGALILSCCSCVVTAVAAPPAHSKGAKLLYLCKEARKKGWFHAQCLECDGAGGSYNWIGVWQSCPKCDGRGKVVRWGLAGGVGFLVAGVIAVELFAKKRS